MQVLPGVYVLSGSCYAAVDDAAVLGDVYAVRTGDGLVLVDCGFPESGFAMIQKGLAAWGLAALPVTHLLLTHCHGDHCGSAAAVQALGAQVVVGAADAYQCENGGSAGLPTPYANHPNHLFPAFKPNVLLEGDSEMVLGGQSFCFVAIPGHTPGSYAIETQVAGKTILFTGDSVQPDGYQMSQVDFGWRGDLHFSRQQLLQSLLKLGERQCDIILPGHGKPCLQNGTRVLQLAAQKGFDTLR